MQLDPWQVQASLPINVHFHLVGTLLEITVYCFIESDAITGLGSGLKIKYGNTYREEEESYEYYYYIDCNFYPVMFFASVETSWSIISYTIRPNNGIVSLKYANRNGVITSKEVSWGDTYVKLSSTFGDDYPYAVIGV